MDGSPSAPPSDVFQNRGTRCIRGGGCALCPLLGGTAAASFACMARGVRFLTWPILGGKDRGARALVQSIPRGRGRTATNAGCGPCLESNEACAARRGRRLSGRSPAGRCTPAPQTPVAGPTGYRWRRIRHWQWLPPSARWTPRRWTVHQRARGPHRRGAAR